MFHQLSANRHSILKNERGVITLDFIFAIAVCFGFCIIFFAVSYTLAMVEVGQYITYATSRAYNGAHESVQTQRALAVAKFDELVKNDPVFRPLLSMGWVTLSAPELGDFSNEYPEDEPEYMVFSGARVRFKSSVMNLRIPFIGNTVTNDTTGTATLNSYLMREVTTQECRTGFTRQRYEKLRGLHASYGNANTAPEHLITDNGC